MTEEHAGALPSRQFMWLGLGLVAMFTAIAFDYHYIDRLAYPFYGLMFAFLVLVSFFANSGGASQRWFNLGFFSFHPPGRAKFAFFFFLAKYFQNADHPGGFQLRDSWVRL